MMLDNIPTKRSRVGSLNTFGDQEVLAEGPKTLAETVEWPLYYMNLLFSFCTPNGEDAVF